VLRKIPADVLPIKTVIAVRMKRKGRMRGLVGLTTWGKKTSGEADVGNQQTITFYSSLLDGLSGRARAGVVAHELAHAWLNEHVRPEQSTQREQETDELAKRWGFSEELAQLDAEAETIR
jgi:Zn-dependent protease with chaperone function